MQIIYNFPHVFYPGSNKLMDARTLRAMIDLLVVTNLIYLEECERHSYAVPSLYTSGVRYDRTLWFEPIPALYGRTYGDCKSLSGAYIAQAARQKIETAPVFRFVEYDNGVKDYHILVEHADGHFEDPSKVLGMPEHEVQKFFGPDSYGG